MMNHPYFQLAASFFFDPPTREDLLATEYGGQPISGDDTLTQRLSARYLPPQSSGEYWSYQQALILKGLSRLDRNQYLRCPSTSGTRTLCASRQSRSWGGLSGSSLNCLTVGIGSSKQPG